MSSIYNLTGEILQLQLMLEDELEDPEVLADTLEAVEGEYEIKLESYCKVIRNLEADIDALKAEVQRLTDRRKLLESNIDRLKKAMYESLKVTGKDKVKGQLFTVSVQRNGGKIPVMYDKNNKDITVNLPDQLVNVVESPNLDAIRELLIAGKTVEGFTLGERGESLRIK